MKYAPWQLSALDLASAIRSREISCAEATASVLARIDAVNPKVNALSEVMADSARAAAAHGGTHCCGRSNSLVQDPALVPGPARTHTDV